MLKATSEQARWVLSINAQQMAEPDALYDLHLPEEMMRAWECSARNLYNDVWRSYPEECSGWLEWRGRSRGGRRPQGNPSDAMPVSVEDWWFHAKCVRHWGQELEMVCGHRSAFGSAPWRYRDSSLPFRFLEALEGMYPSPFEEWVNASMQGREPGGDVLDEELPFPGVSF